LRMRGGEHTCRNAESADTREIWCSSHSLAPQCATSQYCEGPQEDSASFSTYLASIFWGSTGSGTMLRYVSVLLLLVAACVVFMVHP
jgi:hypothetical protein